MLEDEPNPSGVAIVTTAIEHCARSTAPKTIFTTLLCMVIRHPSPKVQERPNLDGTKVTCGELP
jgi:hypothetical protein